MTRSRPPSDLPSQEAVPAGARTICGKIDAREALVKALADFRGAVQLITHDPHLMELIADRLWLVVDGTVRPFDGDLDD
jgi:hypothetical protein